MKIVFFGSTDIALPVLEALHKEHTIVAVVSTPDSPAGRKKVLQPTPIAKRAEELELPVLKPQKLKDASIIENLKSFDAELFVVGSYGKIIPQTVLSLPKYGSLNVHPSLLPLYRGPSPIPAVLKAGEPLTGTSIMIMDEEMDHGPILAQQKVAIDPDDTFITLATKLWELSVTLLLDIIPKYINGSLKGTPQVHNQATHTKIMAKEDGKILWQQTSQEIYNQYRAYISWPGIWTTWNDQILKITECGPATQTLESKASSVPGTVIEGGYVTCGGNSLLEIKKVQLAGKNETPIKNFLNGYPKFIGSVLGL